MVARIIVVMMEKGGTGKTTTARNLAAGLARGIGHETGPAPRVLSIDADSQGNTSNTWLAMQGRSMESLDEETMTLAEVLLPESMSMRSMHRLENGETPELREKRIGEQEEILHQAISTVELTPNTKLGVAGGTLDFVPVEKNSLKFAHRLLEVGKHELRLLDALRQIEDEYEYIVIDTGPKIEDSMVTRNAIVAATEAILPVSPGLDEITGLYTTIDVLQQIQPKTGIVLTGIVPSQLDFAESDDDDLNTTRIASRELMQFLDAHPTTLPALRGLGLEAKDLSGLLTVADKCLPAIPNLTAFKHATNAGMDIFEYATAKREERPAQAAIDLVREIVKRNPHGHDIGQATTEGGKAAVR